MCFRSLRNMPKRKLPVPRTERRLNVTILGTPNAGKSTLLNCLVGSHLAACTQKSHTTRGKILGVYNHRNIQLAFYDTPGFSTLARNDAKILRKLAVDATVRADVVLLVVDAARKLTSGVLDTFAEMVKIAHRESRMEIILVLNKIDLVEVKYDLLEIVHNLVSLINGVTLGEERAHLARLDTTTFMISASQRDGLKDLKNYMLSIAPIRNWTVNRAEGVTDLSREERVEELVRENLMIHTHDEVPYIAGVDCTSIGLLGSDNKLKIDVNIFVNTKAQARIIVGTKGRTMVKIRQDTVVVLEQIFETQVLLYLWVKIRDERKEDDEYNARK